ncbi:AhpC/TSA antioxidant enzyme-domain-containing protein, partial [Schizophyllum fasciatum]
MDSASFYTVPSTMSATPHGGELVLLKDRPLPSLPSLSSSQPEPAHIRFAHPAASDNIFKENRLPTAEQLELAARLTVTSEAGVQVPFYSLWKDQRTIVVFIRHFWCPMCQDYMFSISRSVSAQALRRAGVELVVISNGSYKMIPSYRKIFRTPFALYTDPTHAVYSAMGMTIQSLAKGPRPSYIKHGMAGGIAMVVGNAFKTGMPLFEDGGDISQLGGEFIMGPGLSCSFAHRMRYTRAHTSILTVVAEAGVD